MCAENTRIHLMDKYVPICGVENGKAEYLQAYALSPAGDQISKEF